jgi:hypothetical protein
MHALCPILRFMKIIIGRQMLVIFRKITFYAHTSALLNFYMNRGWLTCNFKMQTRQECLSTDATMTPSVTPLPT